MPSPAADRPYFLAIIAFVVAFFASTALQRLLLTLCAAASLKSGSVSYPVYCPFGHIVIWGASVEFLCLALCLINVFYRRHRAREWRAYQ